MENALYSCIGGPKTLAPIPCIRKTKPMIDVITNKPGPIVYVGLILVLENRSKP